jgi:large repetitive protein
LSYSTNGGTTFTTGTGSSFTLTGDGAKTVLVRQTDVAGNISANAILDFTLDTTAPALTIALVSDTGTLATDGNTNAADLKGTAEANSVVTIKDGFTALGTAMTNAAGAWTFTPTGLTDGAHNFTASQTDVAGNTGTTSLSVTLDTLVPIAPSLALGADTGTSATDKITSNGTVNVSGLEAGASWQYSTNAGTTWTAGVGSSVTLTGDGAKTVIVRQTDVAGNVSGNSASLAFTLDTTAPVPTNALVTDSGALATDNITSNAALKGTAEANSVVTVKDGTTTLGTATASATGAWTFTPTGLANGVHSFSVSQTDVAGNTGTASLAVTLDTIAAAPTLALAADTGTLATDKITNNGTVNVTGLEAGSTWQYSTNAGTTWVTGTGTSVALTGDGAKAIIVRQTDAAGNLSANSASLAFTLDTTAPVPTIALITDSGTSATDKISNSAALKGTAEANSVVTIKDGTTTLGTAIASATGAWTFTPTGITNGAHSFSVSQSDVAGNTGTANLAVTLDTTAVAVGVALAVDTGASATDNITSNGLVNVAGLEAGATWAYSINAGTTWTTGTGTSFTLTGAGAKAVLVRETDVAGNISANASLNFTLDTVAAAPVLTLAADTGSSATDKITSNGTVNVTGLEAGATWAYSLNAGTTWTAGSGTSVALTGDGAKAIIVRQTDVAGNVSANSTSLSFTLDTGAQNLTAKLVTDSGASATDSVTNAKGLTGTAEANAVITVKEGTTTVGTATATAAGVWTFTPTTLTAGAHTFAVSETDKAGNIASTSLVMTYDILAPTVAITTAATAVTYTNIQTFAGTGEAGTKVQLFDGTTSIGVLMTVDATGHWTESVTLATTATSHSITAKDTDTAGNVGTSVAVVFTTDTIILGGTTATVTGTAGNDRIYINSANKTVGGAAGADAFSFNIGTSADTHAITGGTGIDTLDFGLETTAITANLATGTASGTQVGTITVNTVENVVGGLASDAITGDANANSLTGGAGNDTLTGGAGIDTFVYQPAFGFDTITDFTAGAGTTHDILQLSLGAQFSSLAQVIAAATQVGANTVITIDATDTITLNNMNKTALVASNFVFV